MRLVVTPCLAVLVLAGCSGGSREATVTSNAAPTIEVPAEVTGGPDQYLVVVPNTSSTVLAFAASDPDGDELTWTVGGTLFPLGGSITPFPGTTGGIPGPTLSIAFATWSLMHGTFHLLVEDGRGGSKQIFVEVWRPKPPSLARIEPDSAFATEPRSISVIGDWGQVHGVPVGTPERNPETVSLSGLAATELNVLSSQELTCRTPKDAVLGTNTAEITTEWGSSGVVNGAFDMLPYPVKLESSDTPLDAGAGSQLAVGRDGEYVHAAYVENGLLQLRRSDDHGATWLAPATISFQPGPSNPQVRSQLTGAMVVWTDSAQLVQARWVVSTSGQPVVTIGSAAAAPDARLRLVGHPYSHYCAWLSGNPAMGAQRVYGCASTSLSNWSFATEIGAVGANAVDFDLVSDGYNTACLAFVAGSPGNLAVYVARTTNGGLAWTTGAPLTVPSATIGSRVLMCADFPTVHVVYQDGGQLWCLTSETGGASWPTAALPLSASAAGAVGDSIAVACTPQSVHAAYNTATNQVWFSQLDVVEATAQHVTLSVVSEPVADVNLSVDGNYLVSAWRGGSVGGGTGNARVKFATSVDGGETFTAPAGFGDGTAAQEQPILLQDSARIWLGWLDYRNGMPALFHNRSEK